MINLKKVLVSAASCAVLMLSGCVDYGTNLASEYKGYFKYALGDYDIEVESKTEETSDTGKRTWTIEYTNKAGVEHKDTLSTTGSKTDEENDKIILDFADNAMAGSAKDQLYDKIIKKYFPVDYKPSSGSYDLYKGDGYTVEIYGINAESAQFDEKKDSEKIKKAIDKKDGYKISDYDLKKYLSEKTNLVCVRVTLDSHDEENKASSKMKKLVSELGKYAGKESTYSATLYAQDDYDPNGSFIYGKNVLMGKDTDNKKDYTTLENELADKLK